MYFSASDFSILSGRYILLDNDFLGEIFKDKNILESIVKKFPTSYLTIDEFNKFEFLREVFLPSQITLKEEFISQESIFFPSEFHHETLKKIYTNGLIISQIYAHQSASKGIKGWGTVDLLLAGRLMMSHQNSALITGNRRHFLSCVFDTVGLININKGDETIQVFSILVFNKSRFDEKYKELSVLA
ncbi:MAG: hypothetical protein Q7K54_02430 [Candidatus Parcubacteria bacterium]|nr:hypothetical protein [Candidatus Parcubacteria bacterium]